jgi:FkbM family methyltransferase
MVEPDPHNLEAGRHNFSANGFFDRATFVQVSLGRQKHPPTPFSCESDGATRLVAMESVDGLLRDQRIDRVEILLADIQGAELDMLYGAERSIAEGRLRFVVVSTHHHAISGDPLTHQQCRAFIRERGGHILAEHSVAESFSGDGLIVASFDPEDRALPMIPLSRNEPARSLFREIEYDFAEAQARIRNIEARLAAAELQLEAHRKPKTPWLMRAARRVAGLVR